MKKCWIPLAVLAASGTSWAQSSVTLFGIVDASVSHYNVKSTPYGSAPTVGGLSRSQTALSNGYLPSRLGFRGTEDLGGGFAASFWLETPLTVDDGAAPIGFSRRSTVSLSGPFGEVRLGRDYTPTFLVQAIFDPFNNWGVGTSPMGSVGSGLNRVAALSGGSTLNGGISGGTDNYARASNMVNYFLPPDLGGFYGQAQFSLHENAKIADVAGSPSKRGQNQGLRVGYASGPFDVAMSYTQSVAVDGVLQNGSQSDRRIGNTNLGISYNFGFAKLFGQFSRMQDKNETSAGTAIGVATGTTKDVYNGALLGITVPIGQGLVRASYSHIKFNDDAGTTATGAPAVNLDASLNKIALGYVYFLSKRTLLYSTISRIQIRDGQNNVSVMGIATGAAPSYVTSGNAISGYAPRSATGYEAGIQHSF